MGKLYNDCNFSELMPERHRRSEGEIERWVGKMENERMRLPKKRRMNEKGEGKKVSEVVR